jgi:two-component system chemotaxis sensor kinase CheA
MIENFKLAFQEEAREILVELEAALLELNENPGNNELVGRTFRALHTIKGSGAMFGFDDLAAFTHNLENAFDEVRNGRLSVTSDLINLALAALDQIKAMVDQTEVDKTVCAGILVKVRQLTGKRKLRAARERRLPLWLLRPPPVSVATGRFVFVPVPISCATAPTHSAF